MSKRPIAAVAAFLLLAGAGCSGDLPNPLAALAEAKPVFPSPGARIASPFGGGLSEDEQAASANATPPFRNAQWNQEACAVAHEATVRLDQIDAARRQAESLRARADADAFARHMAQLDAAEQEARRYARNVDRCKGVFFRPAVEISCRGADERNAFCGQLGGDMLPGVEFVDDKLAFAHALSWNRIGNLYSQGVQFELQAWRAETPRPVGTPAFQLEERRPGAWFYSSQDTDGPRVVFDRRELPPLMLRARQAAMDAASLSGVPYVMAMSESKVKKDGHWTDAETTGEWAVTLEFEPLPRATASPEVIDHARRVQERLGLATDLGDYLQVPRLHVQALVFDVLVQSDHMLLAVTQPDGSHRTLAGPAFFSQIKPGSPAFKSSYPSYRVHAYAYPGVDDLALLLQAPEGALDASFEMMLEDGSIGLVTLRTPLAGLADQVPALNAGARERREAIEAAAGQWDPQIAQVKRELAEWQASLDAQQRNEREQAEREARQLIAATPFRQPCSMPDFQPGPRGTPTGEINRRIAQATDCDRRWKEDYTRMESRLGELQARYRRSGGEGNFIANELARWQASWSDRISRIDAHNRRMAAHNADIERHNARVLAQRDERVEERRSYTRRRPARNDDGRDYAAEFHRAQQEPRRSMFEDVRIPPRPNHYIGSGYY